MVVVKDRSGKNPVPTDTLILSFLEDLFPGFTTVNQVMRSLDLSRSVVQDSARSLERDGYIRRELVSRGSTRYTTLAANREKVLKEYINSFLAKRAIQREINWRKPGVSVNR